MSYTIDAKLKANLLSRYLTKNNIYFIGNEDIKSWLFYNNEKFLRGVKSFFIKYPC
ncbi:TVG0902798 [Thermoplasma volcanium GSS1]|uniref:TVG0902798 protein n=1 Tax=Thermoplasma volcanium (strain ATCC 51530 / DSM 4299 / JCM 9571 / NBRC 15438 / GSS1) TaxID=273116 RepID=Q97AC5_THEVO|nr:TVG0902798 [Thermoplasma volcanium GSS1]